METHSIRESEGQDKKQYLSITQLIYSQYLSISPPNRASKKISAVKVNLALFD